MVIGCRAHYVAAGILVVGSAYPGRVSLSIQLFLALCPLCPVTVKPSLITFYHEHHRPIRLLENVLYLQAVIIYDNYRSYVLDN